MDIKGEIVYFINLWVIIEKGCSQSNILTWCVRESSGTAEIKQ